jgi:ABC-2 type transport system permease protein
VAKLRAARLAALPMVTVTSRSGRFFSGTITDLRELWKRRELQGILVRREMKNRYKDSTLGFFWTLIKPLTMLAIYYFAIGTFLGAAKGIPNFAIFVFAGLTLWGLYSDILATSTMSILQNAALIKKVFLPREVFPLASVGSAILNFGVQLSVLVLAMLVFQAFPLSLDLLYVLPAVLLVLIYGTALALLLSALNVYLRDVQYLVDVLVVMLFWASPVVYSFGNVHDAIGGTLLEEVYLANPITLAVVAFQRATWLGGSAVQDQLAGRGLDSTWAYPADLDLRMLIAGLVGIVVLWLAHRLFARLQGNFAQEI